MQGPQDQILPDGRLHLHHGPIDLIIDAWGPDKGRAFHHATQRFQTVLDELVQDLDRLRAHSGPPPTGAIARTMVQATTPHSGVFVTPMAAVAGAVADEICGALCQGLAVSRAYVNNGGDIAVHLSPGHSLTAATATGAKIMIDDTTTARGLATSGWRGRSHSLGIADAVTVLANTAAQADIAATLIANAVDLPGHGAIERTPAKTLAPDSDLGDKPVTTRVARLSDADINRALTAGLDTAQTMLDTSLITGAALFLQGQTRTIGHPQSEVHDVRLQPA